MSLKSKEEYEIQHYGFPLRRLSLEHQILVRNKIKESIEILTEKIIEKLQDSNASPATVEAISSKVEPTCNQIFESFQTNFEEFDHLIEKHLHIPDNVILPEDFRKEKICMAHEEDLIHKLELDMESFKQNSYLLLAMKTESEMYSALEETIEKEMKISNEVQDKMKKFHENFGQINEVFDKTKKIAES